VADTAESGNPEGRMAHLEKRGEFLARALHDHWAMVCRILAHLLGDGDEAQDVALEIFRRLDHRRPPEHLQAYLRRAAVNAGLNALRAQQRRRRYEQEAGRIVLQAGCAADPAIHVERAEQVIQVRRVLAAMRPRSARILILRHTGLSYDEIARALGVSPSSVGTLLARAEAAFAKRYRAEEES